MFSSGSLCPLLRSPIKPDNEKELPPKIDQQGYFSAAFRHFQLFSRVHLIVHLCYKEWLHDAYFRGLPPDETSNLKRRMLYMNIKMRSWNVSELKKSLSNKTVQEDRGLRHSLEDVKFVFWLRFFHRLIPHVDILYNKFRLGKLAQ
jgi:hypothetical protein